MGNKRIENNYSRTGVIIIEGHVQGLANARALGRSGIPVYVVDSGKNIASASKYVIKTFKCPAYNSDAFATFLLELGKEEKLDGWGLLPSNDHAVETISRFVSELAILYRFSVPNESLFMRMCNKFELLKLAQRIDIPIPSTWGITKDSTSKLDQPFVVKGRYGLSFYKKTGKKAMIVTHEGFENLLHEEHLKETDIIVQNLIPGDKPTISVGVFAVEGDVKTSWTGEKLRAHPEKFGTGTLSQSIKNDTVVEYAKKILKELNYTGICEIEFMFDSEDSKYKLIEINPRTWLWVDLAIKCGVNFPLILYNYWNGLEINYPSDYPLNKVWRNGITDRYFAWKQILRGTLRFVDYKKSIQKVDFYAIYDNEDKRPFFIYLSLLIQFLKTR